MKEKVTAAVFVGAIFFAKSQLRETQISEVAVTGKFLKIPVAQTSESIIVISREDIQNSPAADIDLLLQQHAGMDIKRRGSNGVQSDVTIRGGSFEQVLILINGIRMNDSQTGHNSLNIPVTLADVERIEVIKGPAARRFGNNAYSGVINIITKTSGEENAKISASVGDFSEYSLGGSANFGNDKFTSLISANTSSSEGYRHNTDYKTTSAFYQNKYRTARGETELQAGFSEKKFGASGFYAKPSYTEQYEETQASVVSVGHREDFKNFTLNTQIYWRRGQDLYLLNRAKPEIYRNMHIGNNIGGEISGTFVSGLGTTGVGLELRKEFLQSNTLGSRNRFVSQAFLEHDFSFLENRLHIVPGISWANFSTNGNFFYPGIDVGFAINQHHKIHANAAVVNRVPTFTDLYYVSPAEKGNPDLKPESANSYELGYRYQNHGFKFIVSGFLRDGKDGIDWTKGKPNDPWMAYNIGKIQSRGAEAEISRKFGKVVENLSVSYTFTENRASQIPSAISKYIIDNLKHQLIAKAEIRILENVVNEAIYRYQQFANGYGYHLVDDKISFRRTNFEAFVLLNNLTNTKYTEAFGVPMPGRWFHAGFSYRIPLSKVK